MRLHREPVPEMVARALDLAADWGPVDVPAVETNGGLGLLSPEFERQPAARKMVAPLTGYVRTMPKVSRIRRPGHHLARRPRRLRLRRSPGPDLAVGQFRDFPGAAHDDAPDAVELAVRVIEQAYARRRSRTPDPADRACRPGPGRRRWVFRRLTTSDLMSA
ncbi:MAG: hypothetical protein K2X87_13165 [Gemmataceae bacterium]|nr:hypothetical protein [Gemmataceae bacterium]